MIALTKEVFYSIQMILYPTETVYGLGVHALNETEYKKLFALKQRDERKSVSWLVRDVADIEKYGVLSERAAKIAERFLPGPLTLVLKAKDWVPGEVIRDDRTVAFRISPDPIAQKVIADFMKEYDAPLTCTSANVAGMPTYETVPEILAQFGDRSGEIDTVIDDGPRSGTPSTIVKVIGSDVTILREGAVPTSEILSV